MSFWLDYSHVKVTSTAFACHRLRVEVLHYWSRSGKVSVTEAGRAKSENLEERPRRLELDRLGGLRPEAADGITSLEDGGVEAFSITCLHLRRQLFPAPMVATRRSLLQLHFFGFLVKMQFRSCREVTNDHDNDDEDD
ncbi:hypothetical protein NL676_025300 [Syzygium grande]|nr:hypothetical protein NL676_025300 [Syzygium grande]